MDSSEGTQYTSTNNKGDDNTNNNTNSNSKLRSQDITLSTNLNKNINYLKQVFCYPLNQDFSFREIHIRAINRVGVLLYLQGVSDMNTIERHIITPLMNDSFSGQPDEDVILALMRRILTERGVEKINNLKLIAQEIVNGNAVLFIGGFNTAILLSTVGYQHRSIEKPTSENSLKGPKESFVESQVTNRALIRKYVKDEKLITENIDLKGKGSNIALMMYIADIADENLVKNVRERLKSIKADKIQGTSILEQYIEDRAYSLVPTVLATERPDRVSSFLFEGHIAILMDGSPEVLIMPITFWSLFHNPEDQYQRWAYGNFIRIIRLMCCFIALLTPGIFLAITSFHVDMIPTDLVLAMAASRERLPFPAFVEVLIMEVAFELLREAGIRIPTPIGPTIGIVGALILGQAAVEASVVSPILVIIVAITGLASFAIPEMSLAFMIRIARFLFLIAGTFLGFFGVAGLFTIVIAYLSTVNSFGVYFMSPYAPIYSSSKDLISRPPAWKQWIRPLNIKPKQEIRMKKP
jgi:spore germination protein KA